MDRPDCLSRHLLHPFIQLFHFIPLLGIIRIQIPLKLRVTQLVPRLKLTILLTVALNGVIGQVNVNVLNVVRVVVLGTCADVSFVVPKIFCTLANADQQKVAPDVEFAFLVQEQVA